MPLISPLMPVPQILISNSSYNTQKIIKQLTHYITLLCLVPGLQQPGPTRQYKCQR